MLNSCGSILKASIVKDFILFLLTSNLITNYNITIHKNNTIERENCSLATSFDIYQI